MRLLQDDHFTKLCDTELERSILRSAYSTLNNLHDPLRANFFAHAIRELVRVIMERIAPDTHVRATQWFHGEKVTRKQRFRYAITGYIGDSILQEHPLLDVDDVCDSLVYAVDNLNKYAHISKGTYDLEDEMVEQFKEEVEDAVCFYAMQLIDTQESIRQVVWELLQDEISKKVVDEIPEELIGMSSQSCVYGADVESISKFELAGRCFEISGHGDIAVELNYGQGDDTMSFKDSYPLTFTATIRAEDLRVEEVTVEVDNSSFYEGPNPPVA